MRTKTSDVTNLKGKRYEKILFNRRRKRINKRNNKKKKTITLLLFVGSMSIAIISFISIISLFKEPKNPMLPLCHAWGYISLAALISYLVIGLKRWLQKNIKEC